MGSSAKLDSSDYAIQPGFCEGKRYANDSAQPSSTVPPKNDTRYLVIHFNSTVTSNLDNRTTLIL
jgi:hypothetical protein